jgi:CRP/FNR family transcriptional regulator
MRRHALWIARAMGRSDLSPLRPADIAALEDSCTLRQLPPGALLLAAGKEVEHVYVVREGEVRLAVPRRVGGRQFVGLVRAGDVVGDLPLFCEKEMPFDALTGSDTTVIEIARDDLIALLRSSPALSLRWTTSIAKRLEQTQKRLVTLLTQDLAAQIATVLLEERERSPDGTWNVVLSHATIAQLLGVRRPSISRVIAQLRDQALVASGYRTISLLDLDGLAKLAGTPLNELGCVGAAF